MGGELRAAFRRCRHAVLRDLLGLQDLDPGRSALRRVHRTSTQNGLKAKKVLEKVWLYDPYHYCAEALIERYVLWLNRNKLTGDVVAESRYKKEDKALKKAFTYIYNNGTHYVSRDMVQRWVSPCSGPFHLSIEQRTSHQIWLVALYRENSSFALASWTAPQLRRNEIGHAE
jgi:hypothetical protein